MSPNAQRIAIADAVYGDNYSVKLVGNPQPEHYRWGDKLTPTPDYLNDLNAMHEAEELLTEEQRIAYSNHTYDVACRAQGETGKWRWISRTAAQRAEAFLRTIGKWEDTP